MAQATFNEAYLRVFDQLGESKKMVLSSSLNNYVTSRMMSVVILGQEFYFQTDVTFRKYKQITTNKNVALCVDNIQIEGICEEVGLPLDNEDFATSYKKHFLSSYNRYTNLQNERLFKVTPTYVERWVYIDGIPYMETYDVINGKYQITKYDPAGNCTSSKA